MSAHDRSRAAVAARLCSPPTHPRPSFASRSGDAMVARFTQELRAKGAEVIDGVGFGDLPAQVGEGLRRAGLSFADLSVAPDPAFQDFQRGVSRTLGKASLTHAFAGVAETGTLVLASGPENPTSLVFLPEVHIVALPRAMIFPCYEDALHALLAKGPLPRAVNLVTGPSRTGDIGGRIVLGAHGPRQLIVIIYES